MSRFIVHVVIAWLALAGGVRAQSFELGPESTLPEPKPSMPIYRFSPDGHLSLLKDGAFYQMYFPGSTSYRALGESMFQMSGAASVLKPGEKGSFDNGGAWLNTVARQDGKKLIGFYHAEDQEFSANPSSRFVAWKSICGCSSADNGLHWQKDGQIITSATPKPARPDWGGCGDFCVVRDETTRRWLCFYQEHFLSVAMSDDPIGKPGSWKKYFEGKFTEAGLGGRSSPLAGLEGHAGGNPSVHFNTYLKKWVMVWGTWDEGSPNPNSIWMSTSDDLLAWSAPKVVVAAKGEERNWYPTILGESDTRADQDAYLCYAHFPDKAKSDRQFVVRPIHFVQLP